MVLDNQQMIQLIQEVREALLQESQGVGDVERVTTLDNVVSLPALWLYGSQEKVVEAPLELLSQPAVEAATVARDAAQLATDSAVGAQAAADTADSARIGLCEQQQLTEATRRQASEAATEATESAQQVADWMAQARQTDKQLQESLTAATDLIDEASDTLLSNQQTDALLWSRLGVVTSLQEQAELSQQQLEALQAVVSAAASQAQEQADNAGRQQAQVTAVIGLADGRIDRMDTALIEANQACEMMVSAIELCETATDLAEELNAHPQMQGDNGNWWRWNPQTDAYEDTGIIARGGGMYPMVRSRRNHVIWYDSTDGFKERIKRRRNHTIISL